MVLSCIKKQSAILRGITYGDNSDSYFLLFKINYFHYLLSSEFKELYHTIAILYTSRLFSMLLNDDIVYIEKSYGIGSLTFVVDEFSGIFILPPIFSIIQSKSA